MIVAQKCTNVFAVALLGQLAVAGAATPSHVPCERCVLWHSCCVGFRTSLVQTPINRALLTSTHIMIPRILLRP